MANKYFALTETTLLALSYRWHCITELQLHEKKNTKLLEKWKNSCNPKTTCRRLDVMQSFLSVFNAIFSSFLGINIFLSWSLLLFPFHFLCLFIIIALQNRSLGALSWTFLQCFLSKQFFSRFVQAYVSFCKKQTKNLFFQCKWC